MWLDMLIKQVQIWMILKTTNLDLENVSSVLAGILHLDTNNYL